MMERTVELEEAVSKLVEEPCNAAEFPYAFLEAFVNKTASLHIASKTKTLGEFRHAKSTSFVLRDEGAKSKQFGYNIAMMRDQPVGDSMGGLQCPA